MKEKAQKGTLKKVLRYIKKYRLFVALSLVLAAVTVAGTLYIPILTGRAVDLIVSRGRWIFPAFSGCFCRRGLSLGLRRLPSG